MCMLNCDYYILHRAGEASVAPSEMRPNQDEHRDTKKKGPLDPTAIYAVPDKKKKFSQQSPQSHGAALGKIN